MIHGPCSSPGLPWPSSCFLGEPDTDKKDSTSKLEVHLLRPPFSALGCRVPSDCGPGIRTKNSWNKTWLFAVYRMAYCALLEVHSNCASQLMITEQQTLLWADFGDSCPCVCMPFIISSPWVWAGSRNIMPYCAYMTRVPNRLTLMYKIGDYPGWAWQYKVSL